MSTKKTQCFNYFSWAGGSYSWGTDQTQLLPAEWEQLVSFCAAVSMSIKITTTILS